MTSSEIELDSPDVSPPPAGGDSSKGSESLLARLDRKMAGFGMREWVVVSIASQIVLLLIAQIIIELWPSGGGPPQKLASSQAMQFVEFQEIRQKQPTEVQDLSDQIIEKEKKEKVQPINWSNAADPTFEANYRPLFNRGSSHRDYPPSARRSNLPTVRVTYEMLIGADGKIKNVRIKRIRSRGNAHKPFEADFRRAVRIIILQKTRMTTRPFTMNGKAVPFVWTETMLFDLQ